MTENTGDKKLNEATEDAGHIFINQNQNKKLMKICKYQTNGHLKWIEIYILLFEIFIYEKCLKN